MAFQWCFRPELFSSILEGSDPSQPPPPLAITQKDNLFFFTVILKYGTCVHLDTPGVFFLEFLGFVKEGKGELADTTGGSLGTGELAGRSPRGSLQPFF